MSISLGNYTGEPNSTPRNVKHSAEMKTHWLNNWRRPGITEENSRELNDVPTECLCNKAYGIEGKPRASISVREKIKCQNA